MNIEHFKQQFALVENTETFAITTATVRQLIEELDVRGALIEDFQRLRVKYQFERDTRIPYLEKLIERYEKALLFYGNKENYELWEEAEKADLTGFYSNIDMDSGDTARSVFEGYKVEKEGE